MTIANYIMSNYCTSKVKLMLMCVVLWWRRLVARGAARVVRGRSILWWSIGLILARIRICSITWREGGRERGAKTLPLGLPIMTAWPKGVRN